MTGRGNRLFYFSLARELKMSVRELLERIDSRELAEWMAYSRLEAARLSGKPSEDTKGDGLKAQLMAYNARQKGK